MFLYIFFFLIKPPPPDISIIPSPLPPPAPLRFLLRNKKNKKTAMEGVFLIYANLENAVFLGGVFCPPLKS
ncbi:hypothetical protein D9628_14180, partial [Staphylococcus aureus]